MEKIVIKIGGLSTARNDDVLITYALGSCVGICLYDRELKLGAMAHAFLPDSTAVKNCMEPDDHGGRYVDTAVQNLLAAMTSNGAKRERVTARLFGGARMFPMGPSSLINSTADIGTRNCKAALAALALYCIPIVESDTGGTTARTIAFYMCDGVVRVNENNRRLS